MSREEFVVSDERLMPVFDAAGHVDEGTVHAWLDGAFDTAASEQVAQHVAACAACADMVAEARGLVAASTRVLAQLDRTPAAVPNAVKAPVAAIKPMRPQWWWKAAAGLFVVIGGTVLLRGGNAERLGVGASTTEARTAEAREAGNGAGAEGAGVGTTGVGTTGVGTTGVGTTGVGTTGVGTTGVGTTGVGTTGVENTGLGTTGGRVAVAARPVVPTPVSPTPVSPASVPSAPESVADADLSAARASVVALSNDAAQMLNVRITGTVRDAERSLPLANVQIGAQLSDGGQLGAITDANGRFEFKPFLFPRGKGLVLIARLIGYGRVLHQVVVTDTVHTAHIILSPASVALSQTVVTADRAKPERIANAPASIATIPVGGNQVATFEGRGVAGGIARGVEVSKSADYRRGAPSREQYDRIEDNPFLGVRNNPLSTFSIDVDRASYGNVRRFLTSGQRPPKDAVRIEELINYFPYTLPDPRGSDPVAISTEVIAAPWQPQHRLVRVALQARRIETSNLPPNNLVFLVDVSGSMNEWNKLPLVQQSLRMLVNELRPQDRVAIVAYAGAAGLVLPSTSGDEKARIAEAIDRLQAGGSTAGGAGIELAYRTAREHFLERGNNRVILATDGDFNVGVSSDAELERLIEQRRRDGTYLTVLGFGTGNYQAAKMEKLAKVGNGNFGYVDTPAEARKLLVEEMGATLLTVANDVKLQVEFNPAQVQAYRLIGYENRLLATEDFNDDTKDAGDIGAGHQVTALYEVVPIGVQGTVSIRGVDSLRYVAPDRSMGGATSGGGNELLFVKLRYKRPGNSASQLLTHPVSSRVERRASTDLRFIAAVASFGMLLRDSEYKGNSSAAQVLEQARAALGEDKGGYRTEFVQLVERWRALGITAGERR